MSDYLSPAALHRLTGSPQRARQIKWLHKHNWVFAIDFAGGPIVLKEYHDKKLGVGGRATVREEVQANWGAM